MRTLLLLALCLPLIADVEDTKTETRTFSGIHLVIADNVNGSIEAIGYAGSDLQIEVTRITRGETPERLQAALREVKLDMTQSGDTAKLYVDGPFRGERPHRHEGYSVRYDFKLRVPASARVDLYTVNQGSITVRGVTGDFDVANVNGAISIDGAAGSGRAHTVNGQVKVSYRSNPRGPSSFETVNGTVDLTFRPGLSADVRLETMNGGLYTDFEAGALPLSAPPPEKRDGRFVFRRGGSTGVRIGTGGIELKAKTLNGDIFLRKQDKS